MGNSKHVSFSVTFGLQVTSVTLLYPKSNEHGATHLAENTSDSAQDTQLELHTWYPYENSESCNPDKGTIHVKVFTLRNLSDIEKSEIQGGSNMTGTNCDLFTHKSVPVIFEPPCIQKRYF
jgi:hypothetical protein